MHRWPHPVLPDLCGWTLKDCKDVPDGACYYDGGAPAYDWQAESVKKDS